MIFAQSAGAVEYTNCTSAEESNPCNECLGYDSKQSVSEVPEMQGLWGSAEHLFITIAPRSTLAWNGSTW